MNFLKTNAGHVLGAILAVVAIIVFHSWIAEHDARIKAEDAIKTAQTQIAGLEQQQTQTASQAAVQVTTLQKQAKAVVTVKQAEDALPTVETDLHPEALPDPNAAPLQDASQKIAVDAVPLYQELNSCRQCSVNLGAAQTELALQKQIDVEKDTEIKALKAKPSFWHRVKTTAETVGIGVAVGYALHR
jgi:hypothetical protein